MKRKKLEIRADKETSRLTIQNKDRDRFYNMMSPEQHKLFDSIQKNVFTFVESKAGTGKSTVTIAAMLDMLISNQIGKIVSTFPTCFWYIKNKLLPNGKSLFMFVSLHIFQYKVHYSFFSEIRINFFKPIRKSINNIILEIIKIIITKFVIIN